MKVFKKIMGVVSIFSLMVSLSASISPRVAMAATVTSFTATLSRLKASTAGNQEIKFVTPTGVASGGSISLTWSADFTMNSINFQDTLLSLL